MTTPAALSRFQDLGSAANALSRKIPNVPPSLSLRILWFAPLPTAMVAEARGNHPDLQVEYSRTRSSDQQFEELHDGTSDAVVTAIDNIVEWNRRAGEGAFCAVAQMETTTQLTLFGRRGLGGFDALAKSNLLVDAPANGFVVALRALLENAGIASADCTFIPAGGVTERLEALLADAGDATLLGPPFDRAAIDAGCPKLASVNETWPQFPGQGLVISRRRLDALRPALSTWLQAAGEAREWIAACPQDAAAMLAKSGLPATFASQAFGSVPDSWRPDRAGIELLIEHRRMVGLVGGDLGYQDLVDTSLVDQIEHAT